MKKIFSGILICFVLCMTGAVYASGETIEDMIDNLNYQIQQLQGQSTKPQPAKIVRVSEDIVNITAGETKDIVVTVKNIGDRLVQNATVKAAMDSASDPISVDLAKNSTTISSLPKNGEKSLGLRLKATNTAEADAYTLNIMITYRNTANEITEEPISVYVRIADDKSAPELVLRDFAVTGGGPAVGMAYAGQAFSLTATMQNAGAAEAKSIQVEIEEGLDSDSIYLSGESNNQYFAALNPGSTQGLNFSLRAHEDIKSGSYRLKFNLKYRDSNDEEKEKSYFYYVNVSGTEDSKDRAYLEIVSMPTLTGTYEVAQETTVVFDVKNTGVVAAKNVKVSAAADGEAVVPRSANVRSLPSLEPGATARMSFSFAPTSKAKTQNYAISFKVEYETGTKTDNVADTDEFMQYVGMNVHNPDEEEEEDKTKISKPKIIIDSYEVDPIIVKAGQEFDIHMSFKNTHDEKVIENIKVVLTPNEPTENSSSPFMPVNGSNTFYIPQITPGGNATKDFRMYAIPNAEPRAYTITVSFSYQDTEYNEYMEEEIIGVTVKQSTKLDTGNIMVATEGAMFQPLYVNFNLMNTGKSTLNNLTVEIRGENFDVSKSFMYFGSLNKSASSYYDSEITPQAPGNQEGVIIITYEDEAGEVTTIERDFVVNVMEMGGMDPGMEMPMDMMPEGMDGGGSLKDKAIGYAKNPLVWVGVVGVAVVAFFGKKFYDKKRRPQYDE